MATINSVLGEIDSKDLGFTLMHEHVMVAASGLSTHYPDLLGPNREQRAIECLKTAKAHGIDTMLDATTFDLGRDPALLKTVAEASGVNLINVTARALVTGRDVSSIVLYCIVLYCKPLLPSGPQTVRPGGAQ